MKKSLAMMLALIMVCALPGIASANSGGSIESAGITHAGGLLKNAVSIELKDITFKTSVQVKLYSGDTLLTTATLQGVTPGSYGFLTCCIATQTADANWALTPWIPKDNVVPNKAVLFVDGDKLDEKTFTLNAEDWANLPGTALPGSIERAGITQDNGVLKNAVSVDLKNVTFKTSVQVKLYRDETLLTTATLQGVTPSSYGFLTCCIATETADEYWALTPWTPKDDVVPNKAVLVVDGHEEDTKTFTLDADEWAALPGTACPYSGSIGGGYTYYTIKKATPKLNTYDHFAYVQGYPDGTVKPAGNITRAETMTLVNRVLNRQPETEDDLLPNMTVWTDNANPKAWYYLAVQEATNSHYYEFKTNSKYEKWTELRETRDWTLLEK